MNARERIDAIEARYAQLDSDDIWERNAAIGYFRDNAEDIAAVLLTRIIELDAALAQLAEGGTDGDARGLVTLRELPLRGEARTVGAVSGAEILLDAVGKA